MGSTKEAIGSYRNNLTKYKQNKEVISRTIQLCLLITWFTLKEVPVKNIYPTSGLVIVVNDC
jgi:hypothetical protein